MKLFITAFVALHLGAAGVYIHKRCAGELKATHMLNDEVGGHQVYECLNYCSHMRLPIYSVTPLWCECQSGKGVRLQ